MTAREHPVVSTKALPEGGHPDMLVDARRSSRIADT
jgi:hypothetical protein